VIIIAQKADVDVYRVAINLIYFIGEGLMSLALLCFFFVIMSIAKEAIIAQENNQHNEEDNVSENMFDDPIDPETLDLPASLNND
jgi:hypothetical protein